MHDSSGLRIRLDLKLRQDFLAACRRADRPAAQVLRDFMRSFVAAGSNCQTDLFSQPTSGVEKRA